MKRLLFVLAALLSVPAVAQTAAAPNLAEMPAGQMLAQAYVVRGLDFFDKAKSDPNMVFETVADPKRTDALYLVVMFANPKKDQSGSARVTYNFSMTSPAGDKIDGPKDMVAGNGALSDAVQKTWIMAPQKIKIPLTATNPAGVYKFDVVVKDQISGTEYKSAVSLDIK
jgi:hypothetical protein